MICGHKNGNFHMYLKYRKILDQVELIKGRTIIPCLQSDTFVTECFVRKLKIVTTPNKNSATFVYIENNDKNLYEVDDNNTADITLLTNC